MNDQYRYWIGILHLFRNLISTEKKQIVHLCCQQSFGRNSITSAEGDTGGLAEKDRLA